MNYDNPTPVRIGMHGTFAGKDYRVAGRSILGEAEAGETYFWNEYNLETTSGETATLVYEQTENGGEWRLFTLFEPDYPMTAAEAATKGVGDRLNLTGDDVRVTFRGASEVYYVEGQAPEGESLGTVAQYFNAEAGHIFQVVSWTGDEVEYYKGVTLTRGMVAAAFGLPVEPEPAESDASFSSMSGSDSGDYTSMRKFGLQALFVVILFVIIFTRGFTFFRAYEAGPVTKIPAPAQPLEVGATGTMFDKHCRVTSHAVVEIGEAGSIWERHEYELTDDSGARFLLVCGDKPGGADWIFCEPFAPVGAPSPTQAAAKGMGDYLDLDGYKGIVKEIFASTVERSDGPGADPLQNGATSYGFSSSSESLTLLARWNQSGIQYFRGQTMTAKKGAECFADSK